MLELYPCLFRTSRPPHFPSTRSVSPTQMLELYPCLFRTSRPPRPPHFPSTRSVSPTQMLELYPCLFSQDLPPPPHFPSTRPALVITDIFTALHQLHQLKDRKAALAVSVCYYNLCRCISVLLQSLAVSVHCYNLWLYQCTATISAGCISVLLQSLAVSVYCRLQSLAVSVYCYNLWLYQCAATIFGCISVLLQVSE